MTKLKQWFSKLSRRERTILVLTSVVVCLAAIDRFIYQPITRQFVSLDLEIQTSEHQIRKNLRALAIRERVIQEHRKFTVFQTSAGSDEEETSRLLSEVEGLARESDLYLINMKPQAIVKSEVGKRYAVEIEIKGEMADLIRFLYGLHHSKHLLIGEQFRLASEKAAVRGYLSITKTVIS